MLDVSLTEAKARLSELIERAAKGEPIRIARRGLPVAKLTALEVESKPIDVAMLRALTETMPMQSESARTWIRKMRDASRY